MADRWALHAAAMVAVVCFVAALRFGLRYASSDVAESRGVEPIILFGIMKIMTGSPLCTPPNEIPFDMIRYMPLYYYAVAYVSELAGLVPGDVRGVSAVGRHLSLAFTLINLAGVFVVLRCIVRCRWTVSLIACSVICLVQFPWGFLARPDALVSFCFIWAFAAALAGIRLSSDSIGSNALMALVGVLSLVAFLTKQNGLQIPFILIGFLIITHDWRRALIGAISFLGPLIIVYVFWEPLFGPALKTVAINSLRHGVALDSAFHRAYAPVFLTFNMAALSALLVPVFARWFQRKGRRQEQLFAFTTVAAGGFGALSALKYGSAAHHLNDFAAFVVMSLAVFVDGTSARDEGDARAGGGLRLAVLVFAGLFLPNLLVYNLRIYQGPFSTFSSRGGIVERLREGLAEEPDVLFFSNDNTVANCVPDRVVLPHQSLAALATERSLVDYSRLQEMVDSGRVGYCVLGFEQSPDRQLGFIGIKADCYIKKEVLGGFSLWIHQKRASAEMSGRSLEH